MKYRPRNDVVVLRIVDRGVTESGIHVPHQSREGKNMIIVAIGPKVEGLHVGDKVMLGAAPGASALCPLPGEKDLWVTREEAVILVIEEPGDRS